MLLKLVLIVIDNGDVYQFKNINDNASDGVVSHDTRHLVALSRQLPEKEGHKCRCG